MLSVSMGEWHSGSNSNAYRIEKVLLIHSYIHMFISRMVNISFSLTLFFFFSLSSLLQMVNISSSSFFFFLFVALGLCCGAWAPEYIDPAVVACGLTCPMACGMLVSWPGIKPMSPALGGRFLTTGAPGKSPNGKYFLNSLYMPFWWQNTSRLTINLREDG